MHESDYACNFSVPSMADVSVNGDVVENIMHGENESREDFDDFIQRLCLGGGVRH